jgi:hypothetical protein
MIRRDYRGRFYGFRMNCESVPILPAGAVRWVWDDPRRIPYLMLWLGERDGLVKDAIRVSREVDLGDEWIDLKRPDGSGIGVYPAWQDLPRHCGILLHALVQLAL